jgi:tRNA-specific 2-thiouridylase
MGETLPEFLRAMFAAPARPGAIVARDGSPLGTHDGIHRFTIGQRRGVGVAVGSPAWVKEIDPATGTITMTTDPDDLLASGLYASGMIWDETQLPAKALACMAQVRYGHQPVPAVAEIGDDGTAVISFETPVRAVTPGQAVVLYESDSVLGGGWIERPMRGAWRPPGPLEQPNEQATARA